MGVLRGRPERPRPPCGNVVIYQGGADHHIISICNCWRFYDWGPYGMSADQLALWTADHKSYFGVGRAWVEKAADIPDEAFIKAIKEAIRRRNLQPPIPEHGWITATRWDVHAVLAGHPELVGTARAGDGPSRVPAKVVLAKAKRLVKRGLIDGCTCGCRGDFEVR